MHFACLALKFAQPAPIPERRAAALNMDKMTQQNAALVEEAAAAARTLENHARELTTAVEQFKLPKARRGATPDEGWDGVERRAPNRATNVTRIGGYRRDRSAQA
jgi:hypothetical protein